MSSPRVLILRAPGTNCDRETAFAFEKAGAVTETLHVNRLLEKPDRLSAFQILCIPGGFSFGDDVAAGRIMATQIEHHLADPIRQFKAQGNLILGICNGFQVLIKSGALLESDPVQGPPATLTLNDSGKYEDRWVRLKADAARCVFLRGIESMYLPVAHAEGKFVPRDEQALEQLAANGQLVLRYQPLHGNGSGATTQSVPYPDNPNGSFANVAGICDTTGRVLGLMPHPERHIDPTQHPRWTRGQSAPVGDGLQVFVNAVSYFGG
jgi:phosphoribosylformylglycinamidine synthase subunit PurQ / glutaminase